jgi:phage terminase large subunit-like protein
MVASLPPAEQTQILNWLAPTEEQYKALNYLWEFWARPKQLAPAGDWTYWLLLAGRGFGKSRSLSEWTKQKALEMPGSRGAIISATAADARDVLIEGVSGILSVHPEDERPLYEPSKRRITWDNGTIATVFTADKPDRLRGPQFHWAICDELCAWRFGREAYDMLMFGLRLGENPQCAIATTPKRTPLLKEIINDQATAITKGSTYENQDNLAAGFFRNIIGRYEGTRLGRQELNAELLEDVDGALWNRALLEATRVTRVPAMRKVVVAVDPKASTSARSESGIVVCGLGQDKHGYVMEDASMDGSPEAWARQAVSAYHRHKANAIVAETNNGGDMVVHTIHTVDPSVPVIKVTATRGKHTRAEPVSALYEQKKIHHHGAFPLLEDQMCSWVPGEDSPDRMDAAVWGFTELMVSGRSGWARGAS